MTKIFQWDMICASSNCSQKFSTRNHLRPTKCVAESTFSCTNYSSSINVHIMYVLYVYCCLNHLLTYLSGKHHNVCSLVTEMKFVLNKKYILWNAAICPLAKFWEKCLTSQYFTEIGQSAAELWLINNFQYGDHPPSWILKICIFGHVTVIKF